MLLKTQDAGGEYPGMLLIIQVVSQQPGILMKINEIIAEKCGTGNVVENKGVYLFSRNVYENKKSMIDVSREIALMHHRTSANGRFVGYS